MIDQPLHGILSWCVLFMLAFNNPRISFITPLTVTVIVTVNDKAQWYNTSPPTCRVSPYFFGRAFCGGFEGAIRFDLAAK